jgi:hypothetical protein
MSAAVGTDETSRGIAARAVTNRPSGGIRTAAQG